MTIKQAVDMAKVGELKGIAASDKINTILSYLNLGMIELYKRFQIETGEVILTLGEDGTEKDPYRMISTTVYKLPSKCMVMLNAWDEIPKDDHTQTPREIPINNNNDIRSIFTVGYNKIQIPVTSLGGHISIVYVANPDNVTIEDYESDAELELPVVLVESLLLYIGYKGHGAIKGSINEENNTHLQRFEASCRRVNSLGLINEEVINIRTVEHKGFM